MLLHAREKETFASFFASSLSRFFHVLIHRSVVWRCIRAIYFADLLLKESLSSLHFLALTRFIQVHLTEGIIIRIRIAELLRL